MVILIFLTSFVTLAILAARKAWGHPVANLPPFPPRPVSGLALGLFFLGYLAAGAISRDVTKWLWDFDPAADRLTPSQQGTSIAVGAATQTIVGLVGWAILAFRGSLFRSTTTSNGELLPSADTSVNQSFDRFADSTVDSTAGSQPATPGGTSWLTNLRIGAVAFAASAGPVYLVMLAAVSWLGATQHPLIEMLKKSEDSTLWAQAFSAAVISAPIFEEVLFRGFFQGFLMAGCLEWQRLQDAKANSLQGIFEWIPIAVSTTVFVGMHVSHGPDWIALIPFSLVQGYIFSRTQSLVAVVFIHFALNMSTFLMLIESARWGA